jgi:hypothetical protein
MGYIKFMLPSGQEQIIDASVIQCVRFNSTGNKIELITGFHTIQTSSTPHEPTPNLPIQYRITGTGFTLSTISRMNEAVINAQVNLFTDFELATTEAITLFELDPFPL